jgi:hypothetical protein
LCQSAFDAAEHEAVVLPVMISTRFNRISLFLLLLRVSAN